VLSTGSAVGGNSIGSGAGPTVTAVAAEELPYESPSLWTNNRVLISLIEYYFETMWKKSRKMQR
jgi:hypothetical protein